MHAERERLVKRTFPALRHLCSLWGEVDLRWGVTEEQKAEGRGLRICLEEIRRFHILWAFWVTVMGGSSIRSQLVKGAIICSSSFHHPFTRFVPQCKHAGSNGRYVAPVRYPSRVRYQPRSRCLCVAEILRLPPFDPLGRHLL